ncbi:MAG TPA: hypothetical protein VFV50_04205, partial [Bdellovibrionales bacterium]|nr:hypothetical protein [Bdellovibrionales bacterium]
VPIMMFPEARTGYADIYTVTARIEAQGRRYTISVEMHDFYGDRYWISLTDAVRADGKRIWTSSGRGNAIGQSYGAFSLSEIKRELGVRH